MRIAIIIASILSSRFCFQVKITNVKCVKEKEYSGGSVNEETQLILPAQVCDGNIDCPSGIDEAADLCNFTCGKPDKLLYKIYHSSAYEDWMKCISVCYNKQHCSNIEFIFTASGYLFRCDMYGTNVSALSDTYYDTLYIMDKVRTVQSKSNCDLGCYGNECYHLEANKGVACKHGTPATISNQEQLIFLKESIPLMLMLKEMKLGLANVSVVNGSFDEEYIRWQDGTNAEEVLGSGKTYGEKYCAYCGYQQTGTSSGETEFHFEIVTEQLNNCTETDWYICKVPKSSGIHMPDGSTTLIKSAFQCGDGDFVSKLAVCDGALDCIDGTDELDCAAEESTDCVGKFQCKDGSCVPYSVFCDFIRDCADGSDEDCVFDDCKSYEMTCLNGQCVKNMMMCNGHQECFDGSDEKCGPGDCWDDSTNYTGKVSHTVTGRTCQRWDSQVPQYHYFNRQEYFPEDTLEAVENYCRVPPGSSGGYHPWCFTVDPDTRYEYCAISKCHPVTTSPDIRTESCYRNSTTWQGNVSHTTSGRTCQMWSSQIPHSHEYTDPAYFPDDSLTDAANFCRDPDNHGPLWCYTTDENVRWEVCDIPFCAHGLAESCFTDSVLWQGTLTKTETGLNCQKWSSQSPHKHEYTDPTNFPDDTLADAVNYCRDPSASGAPWCYTTYENERWEFCNVPVCKDDIDIVVCPVGKVKCHNDDCIPTELICDGDKHCASGEDEDGCQNIDSQLLISNYRCQNSRKVVSRANVCDGQMNCPRGDDERLCTIDTCPYLCHCDIYETRCIGVNSSDNFIRIIESIPTYTRLLDVSSSNTTGMVSIPLNLPYIAKLNMSVCGLYSVSIASMPNLLSLDLSQNRLSDLNRTDVGGIKRLQSIFLQCNIIEDLNLDLFQDLLDMHIINASRNRIHTLRRHLIGTLPKLATLDVSNNRISDITLNMFSGMKRLRVLSLQHNWISRIQTDSSLMLSNLYLLDLSHNQIHKLEDSVIASVKSLKVLFLNNNYVPKLSANIFQWLVNLTHLSLEANKVTEVEDNSFKGLTELKTLDISGNAITKFEGLMFHGLCELRVLKTDQYKFCCLKPQTVSFARCEPQADEFSSCENLLRHEAARFLMWNIGIFALVGNFASFIYRITYDKKKLKIGYGFFVLNLAISDFFMGVYIMIIAGADVYYNGVYIWNDETWRGSSLCKFAGVLSTLSSEASVFFICLITIDRLLVIKYPFGRFRFSTKSSTVASSFTWVLAIVIAILPIVYTDYFGDKFYSTNAVCIALPLTAARTLGWEYSLAVFVFFNFLTFLLIAFGQCMIFKEFKDAKLKGASSARRKEDLTVARNLLLVVSTDFMCWCPVGVMGIMALTGHVISGEVNVWASVFILPINAALNPFLYTLSAVIKKKKFSPNVEEHSQVVSLELKTWQSMWRKSLKYKSEAKTLCNFLRDLGDRTLKPLDIGSIIATVTNELVQLHDVGLCQERLDMDMINVSFQNDAIQNVQLKLLPKPINKNEDKAEDVKHLGIIGRNLLMHIQASSSACAMEPCDISL